MRALLALGHLELDPLILIEASVPLGGDGRVVHEDIRALAILRDETEALLGVEPLHRALRYATFSLAPRLGPCSSRERAALADGSRGAARELAISITPAEDAGDNAAMKALWALLQTNVHDWRRWGHPPHRGLSNLAEVT